MSEQKHTEGPWEILPPGATWENRFIVTAKGGQYDVAVVRNIGNEDNEANARLIAAAPELLAALIDLLPYAEAAIGPSHRLNPPSDSVLTAARAIIAKVQS